MSERVVVLLRGLADRLERGEIILIDCVLRAEVEDVPGGVAGWHSQVYTGERSVLLSYQASGSGD